MDPPHPAPGGFLPPSLPPSPAPSSPSRATALPHPRARPLRPGSAKEELTRRFVSAQLLHVSRRYVKKFAPAEERAGGVRGYAGMGEVCRDLGEVVDVLWRCGTPSLQIPYLLNVAGAVEGYLPAFKAAPGATFALLRKMDHAFASLLEGRDVESGEALPGLEGGSGGMSRTDMVRCRSLVEQTRVVVVEVMGREREEEGEGAAGEEDGTEGEGGGDAEMGWDEGDDEDEEDVRLHMDVARVYEKTIVRLNEALLRGTPYDVGSG